ncbi:monocarboxylate transporter 13-like [Glandiceps talaboti]
MAKINMDKDIDGGWGWVIVVSSLFVLMLVLGTDLSLGPYFVELQRYFQATSAEVSWIMSLAWAVKFSVGPVANILNRRYGTRLVVMVAGVVSTLGCLSCAFVTKLTHLYITYSVFTAFPLGLIFAPTTSLIGEYFDKKYALANGLAFMGTGIGSFILPLLFQALIVQYGWKGSYIVVAGLNANLCVCGALFRPRVTKANMASPVTSSISDGNGNQHHSRTWLSNCRQNCDNMISSLDFALFRDFKVFGLEVLSTFLMSFGLFGTTIHLAPRAVFLGMDANQAAVVMSSFGIAGIVSRMHGFLIDKNVVSALKMYRYSLLLASIVSLCSPLFTTFPGSIVHGAALGFCQGVYLPLLNVVLRETVGQDRFISAFGIATVSMVVGILTGGPVAGWMYDVTGNYHYSYFIGGSFFFASAAVTLVIGIINQRDQTKESDNRTGMLCGNIKLISRSTDIGPEANSLHQTVDTNKTVVKTAQLTEFDIEL